MRHEPSTTPLSPLFPPSVVTAVADPAGLTGPLPAAEQACIAGVGRRRQREFRAGRLSARRALALLGWTDFPLLIGPDRTPCWPSGIVGSISHCRTYCGVAVARAGQIAAIGLDIEPQQGFPRADWDAVLTPAELRWLATRPAGDQERLAKLCFSAKECTYKCQFTLSRAWLGFHDLEVTVDLARREFGARLLTSPAPLLPAGTTLRGRFRCVDDLVLTGMTLGWNAP